MFSRELRNTIFLSAAGIGGGFAVVFLLLLLLPPPVDSGRTPAAGENRKPAHASSPVTTTVTRLLQPISTPIPSESAADSSGEGSGQMIHALRDENSQLRGLNQELQSQLAEVFNWIIKTYKGKYPLPQNQISNLNMAALSEQFELNNQMVDFMNLTTNEVTMINDLFSYGADTLNQLLDQQISVSEGESGRIILHIPPFAEDGNLLRDDIYSALETTLGPYRFDRFMDVSEDKLESSFYYFGDATRTIIFEPLYISDDEPLHWVIKDGWIINEPDQSKTIKATETTVIDIPAQYTQYSDYLPPYLYSAP